ncbi:MAG: HAD-IIIC family phosphatase [Hyphomicrobiaceae bacterium]|nr:HAD-IIIC family phosphatase [Hyphomicrobiaceae bacterium]
MAKSYSGDMEILIDTVLAQAPACLQNRALLQSIDWTKVESGKVANMLTSLDEAKKKAPPWLLTALVVAGHSIADQRLERLSLPLKLLNRLNSADEPDEALKTTAADVGARIIGDKDTALALVKQLKAKGLADEALQLALTNRETMPQLLRPVAAELKEHVEGFAAAKIRVLGTSTTQPFVQDLAPAFAASGFNVSIDEANFGEVIPELLRPASGDYDAYVLMLDLEGFHPHDGRQETDKNLTMLTERIDLLTSSLASFANQSTAPLFLNTLPLPPAPVVGFMDRHHADGMAASVALVNSALAELASQHNQIILIDSFAAFSDLAPTSWTDPKMWYYGRIPYSAEASRALATSFALAWRAEKRGPAKVLVLDLDNTMWGGIFGEDGVTGLQCGDDFPGNAFKAMQNEFLRLKKQGMILAILSKNDPAAISAFTDHPGIIMKEDDFVAHRINWVPKPQNILELASEINVGLDSFIFLDDSPHEREAMRALAPQVLTPELPDDPAQRPGFLRALAQTWPIRLTDEDAQRSSMYLARRKASEAQSSATSFEDYLAGLQQKLLIEEVNATTLPRIAQMHQKTNQFNLTTKRYDEADIKEMMDDADAMVVLGQVSDKFGDHGISICATVAINGKEAELKTLLMSCRVIGREVEVAFLGAILENLAAHGVKTLKASYIPTEKNVIVADFYGDQGLEKGETINNATLYSWNAGNSPLPASSFVQTLWPAKT